MSSHDDITYEAKLSECGEYRYWLSRTWGREAPMVFLMLNPSTADALTDDPTIRRCMGFAERERCGGIIVVNLYALRATDPSKLWEHGDPIGPGNDRWIRKIAAQHERIVLAYGSKPELQGRINNVLRMLDGNTLQCLGKTQHGYPKHPLYLPKTAQLENFQ